MFDSEPRKKPVILIVDDSVESGALLGAVLQNIGTVLHAADGATALETALACQPDLVLLDIEMPGMDGYAVCRALKADPVTAGSRVIFVTSHDDSAFEIESLIRGGVDFISKPLNMGIVRARIWSQLMLKRQTDELAQARRDLSELLLSLPAFVAFCDVALVNRFCNDTEGAWLGRPASDMLGLSLAESVGPALWPTFETALETARGGQTARFGLTIARSGHAPRQAQVSMVPHYRDDQLAGFVLMMTGN